MTVIFDGVNESNSFDIEEIKSCTLRIEERVNELSTQSPKCQSCCKVIQLRTAIHNIGSRLDNLASTSEADANPYEHRFKKIQEQITELKERILVCQPDQDSLDDVLAAHRASTKRGTQLVKTDSANASTHDGSSRISTSESSLHCTTVSSPGDRAISSIPKGVESSQSGPTDTIGARDRDRSDNQMVKMRTRRVTFAEPLTGGHIVRQTTKNFLRIDIWKALAQRHLDAAIQTTRDLECVVTVLLLDISESMATGEAWKQTHTFVNDFLKGLKEVRSSGDEHLKDEYVSVATFGHETKLQMPLTSNYDSVQEFVDRLTLGGPSPLYGGLWMGLAGAMSSKKGRFKNNGIIIHPKIIVLSDCRPTETLLIQGPDDPDMEKTDETLVNVMSALDHLDRRGISVFVVPVGDYDQEFVNIIKPGGRRLYKHTEGRRLARRNYISAKTDLIGFRSLFTDTFSLEDMEDMHEIRMESLLGLSLDQADRSTIYKESTSKMFPPIGSRVRRGPDWHWEDQDHGGPGTVVGHAEEESRVWVTWDADGDTNVYHYGDGSYDVLVTDEPRTLKPGEKIGVGCLVKPGKDGTFQTIREWNNGVVIRVEPPKAHVRWDSVSRGDYSYGVDGLFEIELCPQQPECKSSSSDSVSTQMAATSRPKHKNKNMK